MPTISVRTDPDTERALDVLTADGATRSDAIRGAILNSAKQARQQQLRSEAEALRRDPEDLAEVRRVQAEMEALRAW